MFFIFENSRICEVRDFPHVTLPSYLGLLATTKLIREDNVGFFTVTSKADRPIIIERRN